MSCNFSIPKLGLRLPGFAIPTPPKIPSFSIDVDLPNARLELPRLGARVPGFAIPTPPKIPSISITCPFK